MATALEFLKALYRNAKGGLIELRALPTEKGRKVHRLWSSSPKQIADFAHKYGQRDSGYGVYFGVAKRDKDGGGTKADVHYCPALWVDIDAEVNGVKTEAIIEAIGKLPHDLQPSAVVHSGGGVHCYWFLAKPIFCGPVNTQEWRDPIGDVEAANKVLMDLMGGDACFDITRVLRLPDTYNNKRAAKKLCKVIYLAEHLRYDMHELIRSALSFGKTLHDGAWINPKKVPKPEALDEAAAPSYMPAWLRGGQRLSSDLDRMWEDRVRDHAPRGYIGVHEATIVSAAKLYCAEYDTDYIVKRVTDLQKAAPGVDTSGWDWREEEQKIRRSVETWRDKWQTLKKHKKRGK